MQKTISISLLCILLFGAGFTYGQRWKRLRRELYVGTVASQFLGELGGKNGIGTNDIRDFDKQAFKGGFNVGYCYRLAQRASYEVKGIYAYISGSDKNTTEPFRNNRNLNFRSPIAELNAQFDFFFYMKKRAGHRYSIRGVRGRSLTDYYMYVFAGAGGFYFNPYGKDTRPGGDNRWHALKPLRTEGEGLIPTRRKYSNFQFSIPLGIGIRFAINRLYSIGIEYGYHHTFTDYLDDVSTTYFDPNAIRDAAGKKGDLAVYLANPAKNRDVPGNVAGINSSTTAAGQQRGDPRDKDAYMFAMITVYYKLPRRGFAIPKF